MTNMDTPIAVSAGARSMVVSAMTIMELVLGQAISLDST